MLNGNGAGGNAGKKRVINSILLDAMQSQEHTEALTTIREPTLGAPWDTNEVVQIAQQTMGHDAQLRKRVLSQKRKRRLANIQHH